METLKEMYARHDREMKDLMEDQQLSWNSLNERYGKGNIPPEVYKEWDQRHGNTRLHGLRAQHHAEVEAYPLNPLEYRYHKDAQKQQEATLTPDIFEQLKQRQRPVQDTMSKEPEPSRKASEPDDLFDKLRRKQQQQDLNDPGGDR